MVTIVPDALPVCDKVVDSSHTYYWLSVAAFLHGATESLSLPISAPNGDYIVIKKG